MNNLRYYTDAHISSVVTDQLRYHGVVVLRCQDIGLRTARDEEHLRYATSIRHIVVSHDQDFLRLDRQWHRLGKSHGGIFFVQNYLQGNSSALIKALLEYHDFVSAGACSYEEDLEDRVTYVG
jgi:predicted nuclease of predicted toxin-antitoxin system